MRSASNLLTVLITPDYLVCALLQEKAKSSGIKLQQYQRVPLNNQVIDLRICTMNSIRHHLYRFMDQTNSKTKSLAIACLGKGLVEQFISVSHITPDWSHFPAEFKKQVSNSLYLYPTDNNRFLYYVCGMAHQLLFQYQLLAFKSGYNLVCMTSAWYCLLHVYRFIHATTFRQAKLAVDMQRANNNLEHVLCTETITRIVTINPSISIDVKKESSFLFPLLGLYLAQKDKT